MVDYDLGIVIPARLHSSRIEKKVFSEVTSRESLLGRKITQLRNILPEDRVVVNTESELIAEEARKYGAKVQYREQHYAIGHLATFSELITHVVSNLDFEHIGWCPFVVPFFESNDFSRSFERYKNNVICGHYDSLVSVISVKHYFWDDHGPINYSATKEHTISQHLPDWYQVTNGNYMAPKKLIMDKRYLLGDKAFLDVCPPKCGIDIDNLFDLALAKAFAEASDE